MVTLLALAATALTLLAAVAAPGLQRRARPARAQPKAHTLSVSSPRPIASPKPIASHSAAPVKAGPAPAAPPIVQRPIPYGSRRRAEMAAYCRRHYHIDSWHLVPHVIVLHFTDSSTFLSAWYTFVADTPQRGELPGVASQFIIDKDGRIYQLVPTNAVTRHTVGLNYCAIGIEMVQQEGGAGAHWADRQILGRPAQIGAALRLVRWLQHKYHIATKNVIGHAMANGSPFFRDYEGWRNDHTDWLAPDVAQFRARLATLSR
jgi:N-acetylmuramoyl-L-alanine amidase